MGNKIETKKLIGILLSLICCFSIVNPIYATGSILTSTITPSISDTGITGRVSEVLGYVSFGCWAVAIGMLIYVGIKYLMASANEKADLKNASIRYLIGAIMVAAASSVFSIVMSIAEGLSASGS